LATAIMGITVGVKNDSRINERPAILPLTTTAIAIASAMVSGMVLSA
jgi:hypothetical protein